MSLPSATASTGPAVGSPASAPSGASLGAVAVAALGAAVVTVGLAVNKGSGPVAVQAALFVWIIAAYTGAGLIAWWRRPESRFGPLMVVIGFVAFGSTLSLSTNSLLFTVGLLLDLVLAPLVLHVLLAFPTGHLAGPTERWLVVTAYATALAPQVVRLLLGEASTLLAVVEAPSAALATFRVQASLLVACCIAGVVLIVVRRRAEGHALRRPLAMLVYSFSLALVMIAFLLTTAVLGHFGFENIRRATLFTLGLAPAAFLLGLLDARLTRSSVADLVLELRNRPAPADLRDALARALRDPSLELVYWLPEFESWADLDGVRVERPEASRRTTTTIERDGRPIAALLHDPSLDDEPELLDAVGAVAGFALENGQLQAELGARIEELQVSRDRIVEASTSERKRLERNLHDGAQQRLVALSVQLTLLERRVGFDPDIAARVEDARAEIGMSLSELRDVARGLDPPMLSRQGLRAALEAMATRAPVPVELTIDLRDRLPQPVEAATYYVVSESLANIGKHAHASAARVSIARSPEGLLVEVVDDGVGGADTAHGSGLRGLSDRVEALGGRFEVWSPDTGGTGIRAQLPCR